MQNTDTQPPPAWPSRWTLLRDMVVFQAKLFIDGLRDFVLLPVSFIAGIVDIVTGGPRTGERFYSVVRWGRRSERWIDLFEAEERIPPTGPVDHADDNRFDDVVEKVEAILVEHSRQRGVTASAKRVIDKALDALQGRKQRGADSREPE